MSGHLGNAHCTAQNLEVVRVDAERNLILVKGSVPGHKDGRLYVRPATKSPLPPPPEPKVPDPDSAESSEAEGA